MNDETRLITLLSGLVNTPRGLAGAVFTGSDLDDMINRANGEDTDRGDLLDVAGVTLGEPRHQVADGQTWALGPHVLVVADVYTGWPLWSKRLTEGAVFLPYPTPLIPHSENLPGPLVMVQPEKFLAGHMLDKWQALKDQVPLLIDTAPAAP